MADLGFDQVGFGFHFPGYFITPANETFFCCFKKTDSVDIPSVNTGVHNVATGGSRSCPIRLASGRYFSDYICGECTQNTPAYNYARQILIDSLLCPPDYRDGSIYLYCDSSD